MSTVALTSNDDDAALRRETCVNVDTGFKPDDCRYTTVAQTPNCPDAGVSNPAVCDAYPATGGTTTGGTPSVRNAESNTNVNTPNPGAVMFGITFR
ncbi:hypothetical protein [Tessaracoccus sp.]